MDLPELFLRKGQDDPYANTGRTEEHIKDLLSKDKRLKALQLKSPSSRDISHIRDKPKPGPRKLPFSLPTEINHLRLLMDSSNSKGIQLAISPHGPNPLTCTHKICIDRVATQNSSRKVFSSSTPRKLAAVSSSPVLEQNPLLEREFLGSPTGAKEIESLSEWFKLMKQECVDDESTEVVYTMCARELLRQVSVQSSLRGKILQEIIEMQPGVFGRKWEKANLEFARYREEQSRKNAETEQRIAGEVAKKNQIISELENSVTRSELIKIGMQESINSYKRSLGEMQKKYIECEDMWRGRLYSYLEEVKKLKGFNIKKSKIFKDGLLKLKKKTGKEEEEDEDRYQLMMHSLSHVTEKDIVGDVGDKIKQDLKENVEDARENQRKEGEISAEVSENQGKEGEICDEIIIKENPEISKEATIEESKLINNRNTENSLDYLAKSLNIPENHSHIDEIYLPAEEINDPVKLLENQEEGLPKSDLPYEIISPAKEIKKYEILIEGDGSNEVDIFSTNPHNPLDPKQLPLESVDADHSEENPNVVDAKNLRPEEETLNIAEDLIFEAPEYDEESREYPNPVDSLKQRFLPETELNKSPSLQSKITQTEDILFEKYMIKLQNIEEVFKRSKPEEMKELHTSLHTILENDSINISQSSRKMSLQRSKSRIHRYNSDRVEVSPRFSVNSPELEKRVSSPISKEPKDLISEVLTSVAYVSNSLMQKRNELSKLDDIINKKMQLIRVVSDKKIMKNLGMRESLVLGDRRRSEMIESEVSNASGNSKLLKKGTLVSFNESENMPWDEGYEVGYGDGKIQGYLRALEKIKETAEFTEVESGYDDRGESRQLSRKKSPDKVKIYTRFSEFNFHIPTKTKPKKIHPGSMILGKFLQRPLSKIKMRSTLSRKNLNKIIMLIYTSALPRISIEASTTLTEVTYDEFYGRFGLKTVCNKKFLELIASAISNAEHRRCLMYLRLMKCGEVILSYNYSKYTLCMYLACLQFINNSKAGIHFATDDEDKIMIPAIRMNECVKDKFENFADKSVFSTISTRVESKVTADPRKINPGGLVEMEACLEIICDVYERYVNSLWKGIHLCLKALGEDKKHTVLSIDFNVIFRALGKNIKEGGKEATVEEMYLYCIKNNIGSESEVLSIIPSLSEEEIRIEICEEKEKFLRDFEDFTGIEEKYNTYDGDIWRLRMERIENSIDIDIGNANLAWKLYKNEMERVLQEKSRS